MSVLFAYSLLHVEVFNLLINAAPVVTNVPAIVPMPKMDGTGVTATSFTVEFDITEELLVNGPIDK